MSDSRAQHRYVPEELLFYYMIRIPDGNFQCLSNSFDKDLMKKNIIEVNFEEGGGIEGWSVRPHESQASLKDNCFIYRCISLESSANFNNYVHQIIYNLDSENRSNNRTSDHQNFQFQEADNNKKPIHLPVDLNLIKQNPLENIVPLDVSVVKPDDVLVQHKVVPQQSASATKEEQTSEYSPQIDVSIQPSRELSQEEVNKFLATYYNKQHKLMNEPQIEHGFKPIIRRPSEPISQPSNPQTYRSHKQPNSTPGLSSYTSKYYKIRNKHKTRGPRSNLARRQFILAALNVRTTGFQFLPEQEHNSHRICTL
nr:unnamed protein product [Callosobruchus analis]